MEDYNNLITSLLKESTNTVYLYRFGQERYYAVRGLALGVPWLVIFSREGVMETAFPPRDIDDYLQKGGFEELGSVGEVLRR